MSSARRFALVALAAAVLACAPDFGRADGIAALQNDGMSAAEATCVANTLHALQQVDVLAPGRDLTEADRGALQDAYHRCTRRASESEPVTAEVLSESERPIYDEDYEESLLATDNDGFGQDEFDEAAIEAGRQRLTLLGRDEEFITCVVDHLRSVESIEILADEQLGMGLYPVEADAYAACS